MAMNAAGEARGKMSGVGLARLMLLLAGLGALLGGTPARAGGGYPDPVAPRINDFAHILSDADINRLHERFARLDRERGIKAAVVTINSIYDYSAGSRGFEGFCTGLFNEWGIGDRARNNGALLLVAVRDRKVRIELGKSYGRGHDGQVSQIIQRDIIPQFRNNNYRAGILNGAESLARVLSAINAVASPARQAAPAPVRSRQTATNPGAAQQPGSTAPATQPMVEMPTGGNSQGIVAPPPAAPRPAAAQSPVPFYPRNAQAHPYFPPPSGFNRGPDFGMPILILVFFGGLIAVVVVVLSIIGSNRPRLCPHCGQQMQLLDEFADDMFLDSGQKLEERLDSVNYDVHKCPGCGMHTLERKSRWFSSYSNCPQCSYKTMREECQTVEQPTYHSTGRKLVSHSCQNCGYVYQDTVVIPMLQRSDDNFHHHSAFSSSSSFSSFDSSSSSSSFSSGSDSSCGGGSSSGGGASGSW